MRLSQSDAAPAPYTEATLHALALTDDQAMTGAYALSPPRAAAQVRIAYLLSRYPAVSHTFFLSEVLGLRALGVEIETASINAPDRPRVELPLEEVAEADKTYYLKGAGAAGRLLKVCCAHPVVLLRGLLAVVQTPRLALRQRAFWLLYLAEAMLVGQWMRERRLPHLHVHFGGAVATVGMLTARAWRVPWSLTVHGPEELLNVDAYHLREKIESAKFCFCISDFCRSQLCRLTTPERWSRLQVMRLGVDPAALEPKSRRQEVRALQLVCTGRLVPEKGHHVLLEALLLLRERGITPHTTLIGGGPEHAGLQAFCAANGLSQHVIFTGPLPHAETLAYVRQADVFTLASFAEGIPVALMEAMAFAVPCVSTAVAGIPELIESGVDGLLVAPANAEALADALASLLMDSRYRESVGARGRRRVLRQYNLPVNHERLAEALAAEIAR